MKKLAIVLSLISCYSFAEEAAGFENNAGGWTVITTRTLYCGDRGMNDGYAFGKDSHIRFCWVKRNNAILVVFEDGTNRVWPSESFKLLTEEPEYRGSKS